MSEVVNNQTGQLILVNEKDEVVGYGEKMEVHEKAQLHRAFSIFVMNKNDQVMIQKRADHKYHSGGLWANTCCSHPIKDEEQEVTVHRRLKEEMGFTCPLKEIFSFVYKAELDKGLTEHEFDHVYFGRYEGNPDPNPEEVGDWKWIDIHQLNQELISQPEKYVYWIRPAFQEFYNYFKSQKL